MKAHAAMHATVENQVATGFGPSTRALTRLQEEGLSRHEAAHAIAYVIAQFIYELNQEQSSEQQASFQTRMNEAIEKLHAAQWLSLQGGGMTANPSIEATNNGVKRLRVSAKAVPPLFAPHLQR